MVGRVARAPLAFLASVGAAGFLHQLAQRHRRAAGLAVEPFPVARQQRDFARDHAQPGPPLAPGRRGLFGGHGVVAGRGRCRGQARQDFALGTARVDVEGFSGRVVEDENRRVVRRARGAPHGQRDVAQRAAGQQAMAVEGGAGKGRHGIHHKKGCGVNLPG